MPKIKSHRGAKSRFKITGTGKILHGRVGKSHLRMAKPSRVKRSYYVMREIDPSNRARIRRVLPYG